MVNYCCVYGCGRNSRQSKHLNFYGLPKERHRKIQWLQAAGREDLLQRNQVKLTARFCSRHFPPSSIKNKHLCVDAVPTRCLPGVWSDSEAEETQLEHRDIVCNNCQDAIHGFRYKCVTCADFDLCSKCEGLESHPDHYMLRIPKPMKLKLADDLIEKWKNFFKAEDITVDDEKHGKSSVDSSDDDEPITKYARQYDSGIDLTEDEKEQIRNEVTRVLNLKLSEKDNNTTKRKSRRKNENMDKPNKRSKSTRCQDNDTLEEIQPKNTEIVFVNEGMVDMKNEISDSVVLNTGEDHQETPIQMKINEDLTEFIIEMSGSNQKTVYKYSI